MIPSLFLSVFLTKVQVGGRESLLPVFTICAILGAFSYNVAKYVVVIDRSTIAALVAALCMILLSQIEKLTKRK